MLILLPPSETKSVPEAGPTVDLASLVAPSLSPVRRRVLAALVRMCAGDPRVALRGLSLSDRQIGEVHRNAALKRAACAPAVEVYTGVLYHALRLDSLPAAALHRANERVLVASALFGLVRLANFIPAYRLSGSSSVTGIDSLTRTWKSPLGAVIAQQAGDGIVFDLRSGDYASLGPVPADLAHRTVIGKVVDSSTGRKVAVSHFNKATKGFITRELVRSAKEPRTPQALAAMCAKAGFDASLIEPSQAGRTWMLEIEQHHV